MFNNLDKIDNKKDDSVCISALADVLDKLEDRNNLFFFRRQTKRKINSEKLTRELSALDRNQDGRITLEELYEYVRRSKRADYQRSHSKDRTMTSLLEYLRVVANAKIIKKWPPPSLIPTISLLVIIIHFINLSYPDLSYSLRFDSYHRNETWRYLTYSLVHRDVEHIVANLLLLLGLGLVLEMVNGSWRVGLIFFSGILSGSLCAYCFDPLYGLIGCSGGVYSITVAHLSALILNWNEDTTLIVMRARLDKAVHAVDGKGLRALQMMVVSLLILGDVSWAVYNYNMTSDCELGLAGSQCQNVSYVAHLAGAVTGLLVGFLALRNRQEERWEKVMKRIILPLVIILFAAAIAWNIFC